MGSLRCSFGAGVLGAAMSWATSAGADEPVPPERDTSPATFPVPAAQPNLLLIGGVVAGVWYGAAVGTSYLWSDSPGASALRIPVAGPYMALARTGCGEAETGCGTLVIVLRTIFTSLAAVGQTGGVLAMVEGVMLPTASPSGGERAGTFTLVDTEGLAVSLEPSSSGPDNLGFSLAGAF
jgi:hypothetical protein